MSVPCSFFLYATSPENVYELLISLLLSILCFQKLLAVCSDRMEGVNSGAYPRGSHVQHASLVKIPSARLKFRAMKTASGASVNAKKTVPWAVAPYCVYKG